MASAKHIHMVGIGGIGISSLARFFVSEHIKVSGSDAIDSSLLRELEHEGIRITIGHKETNIGDPDLVIYSAAVKSTNPELLAAKKKQIKIQSYAEALGELTKQYETIAISGSHGKSTTTAMTGLALIAGGLDPTVIVGTKLREFAPPAEGSNFRKGHSRYLVIEADEWNKSFHHYYPKIAVITNIDKEHLDTYKDYAGVLRGFAKYLENLGQGTLIANYADPGLRKIVKNFKGKVIWYNEKPFLRHKLSVPGMHNQWNAEAAAQVAKLLGVKKAVIEKALHDYQGAWRRLERLHPKSSVKAILYSDYAHHPTEIRATLQALREEYPNKKIIAVFQPHLADRLNRLFKDFAGSFSEADAIIFLPVYKVKGRHTERGKGSRDLQKAIPKKESYYAPNMNALEKIILKHASAETVIVCMSAGDLDNFARTL